MRRCGICLGDMESFFLGNVLGKYDVQYFKCKTCGSIQTEQPYWLDEAYSDAIADTDIGLCSRNVNLVEAISAIIKFCFSGMTAPQSFLDYGGGYGMLTRLLRDKGFPFEWYDMYCENLFARSFEKSRDEYDLITAVELFEHLPNPLEDVAKILNLGENLIFTTELLPNPAPKLNDWWYYSPETGQHITFYTEKGLELIARKFGRYYTGYAGIHIFSKRKIPKYKICLAIKLKSIINRLYTRESLLMSDYNAIRSKLMNK